MFSTLAEWTEGFLNHQGHLSHLHNKLSDVPRWVWAGVCVFGTVVYLKVKYERTYREWEKQNIPGPKPYLFMGTNYLMGRYKNFYELNVDLSEKYGKKGYFG